MYSSVSDARTNTQNANGQKNRRIKNICRQREKKKSKCNKKTKNEAENHWQKWKRNKAKPAR